MYVANMAGEFEAGPELMGGKVQDFIKKYKGKWKHMKPAQKALAIVLLGPLAPALLAAALPGAALAAGPVAIARTAKKIKAAGGVKNFIKQFKGKWKQMKPGQKALAIALLGPMAPALLGVAAAGAVALAPGLIPTMQVKAIQAMKKKRDARKAAEAAAAAEAPAPGDESAPGDEVAAPGDEAQSVTAPIPVAARTEAGRTQEMSQAPAPGEAAAPGDEAAAPGDEAAPGEAPKKKVSPGLIVAALAAGLPFIMGLGKKS
jgi:hypothetical protein